MAGFVDWLPGRVERALWTLTRARFLGVAGTASDSEGPELPASK